MPADTVDLSFLIFTQSIMRVDIRPTAHLDPPRSLCSSNTNLITRPADITSNFSSRTFSASAPSAWNSLPAHIRSIDTLSTVKRHLNFHLFQSAFTV